MSCCAAACMAWRWQWVVLPFMTPLAAAKHFETMRRDALRDLVKAQRVARHDQPLHWRRWRVCGNNCGEPHVLFTLARAGEHGEG